jgi:hypothetical protein
MRQLLLDELASIAADWLLVPIGKNKQPLGFKWQHNPYSPVELQKQLKDFSGQVPVKNKEGSGVKRQKLRPL